MVRLQIRLKSESAAFLAGEQVSGDLILDVDSPTKARRVCLEAFGHAYNHWTESHSDGKGHSHTESYTAEKQFINVVILVWKAPGGGTGILEPGLSTTIWSRRLKISLSRRLLLPVQLRYPTRRSSEPSQ